MAYRTRFAASPRQSCFLFGPRGTGKSTWLRHQHPDALFIDLLLDDTFRAYSARPERLRDAIEVKRARRVRPEDLRGLKAFRSDYPQSTATLLYGGTERLVVDGIRCEPVERFLRDLTPEHELCSTGEPDSAAPRPE